jgi:hypothetical protein
MRIESQPNNAIIWLAAKPRFQAQAADYKQVDVMLDQKTLLPSAMQVQMPDGSKHVYIFDLAHAAVNDPLAKVKGFLNLNRPALLPGWKHIVEQPPMNQAAIPQQPAVK